MVVSPSVVISARYVAGPFTLYTNVRDRYRHIDAAALSPGLCPSLAALVLAVVLGGDELRRLAGLFSLSLLTVRWSIVAVFLPLLMIAIAIAISVAAFGAAVPAVSGAVIRRGDRGSRARRGLPDILRHPCPAPR
jgi:hypothetical protein